MTEMNVPFVSVILPIRNESRYIYRTLCAILTQDYPITQMEVIVVDGMSDDGTRSIVREIAVQHSENNLFLLDNIHFIFSTGFNLGLSQARGEIIIMMGGHTEIDSDYVHQCVTILENSEIDCVGGSLETIAETFMGQAIAIAMSSTFGVGGVAFRTTLKPGLQEVDTVAFGAYKLKTIEKCGPLDVEMIRNQDDEFNYRLREYGGKILFSPKIRSRYYSRSNLPSLWKQYHQYGLWKVRVLQKHPRQMRLRQFVPPVFVLTLLVSLFFALLPATRPLSPFVPLLYLFVNLCASVITASKRGWQYLPLLPVTFAILHLSYGSGFLVGLFKFWNRWDDKKGKVPAF